MNEENEENVMNEETVEKLIQILLDNQDLADRMMTALRDGELHGPHCDCASCAY